MAELITPQQLQTTQKVVHAVSEAGKVIPDQSPDDIITKVLKGLELIDSILGKGKQLETVLSNIQDKKNDYVESRPKENPQQSPVYQEKTAKDYVIANDVKESEPMTPKSRSPQEMNEILENIIVTLEKKIPENMLTKEMTIQSLIAQYKETTGLKRAIINEIIINTIKEELGVLFQ